MYNIKCQLMRGGALEKAAPTQIEPGSSEVRVVVTLSYELR